MEDSFEYKYLDFVYLENYFKANKSKIKELFKMFLSSSEDDRKRLRLSIDQKKYADIKIYAHKLKAAYKYLGVAEMGDLFASIETHATQQRPVEEIKALYEESLVMAKIILEEINNFLNNKEHD